ncbi:MAG: PfkB family carbohydrate kinase, partial [Maritimibacter sp.]
MILCCGEALIDMLPRETGAGEAAFAPYAGGAVFNTAIALGRLGAETGFFSGLSTDLFGTILTDSLAASKVQADLAVRSDRPTTLAFVTLTNGQAKYAFYDENTAGRMMTPDDLPELPN